MKKWKLAFALGLATLGTTYAVFATLSPDDGHLDMPRVISGSPAERHPGEPEPCKGMNVREGDDLTAVANAAPKGTTFCISGFHRLSGEIVPKDGQRFIGVGQPVLNGSKLLTSYSEESAVWV